ncbi:MAG: hypothetical protein IPP79_03305 [Chitinophagaceae bacterium]|nr:hypothetical protein [Chitinophagaceae bacterium]
MNYRHEIGTGGLSFTNYGLVSIYSGIPGGGYGFPPQQQIEFVLSDFEGNPVKNLPNKISWGHFPDWDDYTKYPGGFIGMSDSALFVCRQGW